MKLAFKLSLAALTLTSATAQAVTLDYRFEYKADSKTSAHRYKIGHTFESGLFTSIEAKIAEKSDVVSDGFKEGTGDRSGNGGEWAMGYKYRVTDKLVVAPGVNIDIGDSYVGYRVEVKSFYSITDNWVTTLRWRGGIQVDEVDGVADKNYNQINWELGYKNEHFSITGDYEYKFTNYDDYKGEHNNWLYNVNVSVPINKQWVPYGEIGYVSRYHSTDDSKDEKEMRYRLGIKYNF